MSAKIFAATDRGVRLLIEKQDGWSVENTWLEDRQFTSVAVSNNGAVLAGAKNGLFLTQDEGKIWQDVSGGLSQLHIRSVAFHPENAGFAYAGTEPAAIFYSKDGGMYWQESLEVARLRDKNDWYLPYSPEAGCIRGFAFDGASGFAAVEVGGMLETQEYGESWKLTQEDNTLQPAANKIHADVHRVFIHPKSSNHVVAPTGGGLFISEDGGQNWNLIHHGYCRSVWLDPADTGHMILGPAGGPDRSGKIEETKDAGKTWADIAHGLDTPWPRTMVEHFFPIANNLFAVLSNGRLIYTSLDEFSWKTALPEESGVRAVAAL